jgi:hypothetical protein
VQILKRSARYAAPLRGRPHNGWLVSATCLALLVAGCGGNELSVSANPVAPTDSALPPVGIPSLLTVSGVVAEDGHPIENAQVGVWWSCGRGCGRGNEGMTDATGRYKVAGILEGETVWAIARKDGYVQQCIATVTTKANVTLDVRLTSTSNLSTAHPVSRPGSRTVSGWVSEATPSGRQAIEGASVYVYSDAFYYIDPVAVTRSDAAGHFMLCELPKGTIPYLYAEKDGYHFSHVSIEPGEDAIVDIEGHR